jgi:FAD/FMN-containing dehydrogenase
MAAIEQQETDRRFLTLLDQLPEDILTRTPEDLERFGRDWTRRYTPSPCGVALPRSTEEVVAIVKVCSAHCIPIVPSGGRTGLAGGAVACSGELVVSLSRMNALHPVDTVGRTVRVGAGAVTQAVQTHCEASGLTWPVDFASKGSSQIGGNISTNAGGLQVIRYGHTRQWVLGLQVVTPTGAVLELNGALEKNNSGLDLRQLYIGTEGTLGIITEATLRLEKRAQPDSVGVFLFGVESLHAALSLLESSRRSGPFRLRAFEFLTDACMQLVLKHRRFRPPFKTSPNAYVLMEIEGRMPPLQDPDIDNWLATALELPGVLEGVAAQSEREQRDLWAFRENITESIGKEGVVHKNDVAVPVAGLATFVDALTARLEQEFPRVKFYLFGHLGDGNLHLNVVKPVDLSEEAFASECNRADNRVFELVADSHGSISAEHGIGLVKKDFLHFSRTPAELDIFRRVKQALDPLNIMNPGKIFD